VTSKLRRAVAVAPMHLVTAPQPGSGKSYLADTASMIAAGERFAIVAVAPESRRNRKTPDRQRTRQLSYNRAR
jgi:putative DNA primase/helicase